jgi:metal-sulfur cluster biosynthetic enzyme
MMAAQPKSPESLAAAVATIGERVVERLKMVFDPEIPVNIFDLGLIYKIDIAPVEADGRAADAPETYNVTIDMTLTTPNCPVAGNMPGMVQSSVLLAEAVDDVQVNLVWDPPWEDRKSVV